MSLSRARLGLVGLLVALVCGCSTLPDSGEVHTSAADAPSAAPYFRPPGPTQDDTPSGIVRGFLLAMQANPPSVAVARDFLSERGKESWKPSEGMVVYDASSVETSGSQVTAQLRGAHRLSPEGSWLNGTESSAMDFPLTLVQEDGQWRIDDPPDVLAVPASYFSSLYVGFHLYFFDSTGTVLVPTKIYVPRGEETATNLVRGLLAGPLGTRRDVAISAFPPGLDLDLGVVVNDAGIADVPLGPAVLDLAPTELTRMVVQLAWTLRQVPGITRLKVTVDGAPVALPDGRTDVSVGVGSEYDPVAASQGELLAISEGRVVRYVGTRVTPVDGPFGQEGFALRSLAWNPRYHAIAAVSASGRRVFVAADSGPRSATRVRTVLDSGTSVLRPTYDRFGGLWLVDATPAGAVVHLVNGRRDRVVPIEGVSGRPVSGFTVTRDGSALVAVLGTGANPVVEVSSLVRGSRGRLQRATPSRTLEVAGADLGAARDVAQQGATSVAVLAGPPTGADHLVYVELDGSPGLDAFVDSAAPLSVPGPLSSLTASPDPALTLHVVTTDGRLFTLLDDGRWVSAPLSGVLAATYGQ